MRFIIRDDTSLFCVVSLRAEAVKHSGVGMRFCEIINTRV